MKKRRVALYIIPAIIVIIVVLMVSVYPFIKDISNRKTLIAEAEYVMAFAGSTASSEQQVAEMIDRRVTDEKYHDVEKAVKAYARKLNDTLKDIEKIVSDDTLNNVIGPENLREDGKEFVNTKKLLKQASDDLEALKDTYKKLATETYAISFAKNEGVKESDTALFVQATYGIISTKTELMEGNLEIVNDTLEYLSVCNQIIEHLSINSDKWYIAGTTITFYDANTQETYVKLKDMLK